MHYIISISVQFVHVQCGVFLIQKRVNKTIHLETF